MIYNVLVVFYSVLWCFVVFNYAFVANSFKKRYCDLVLWCSSRDATASKNENNEQICTLHRNVHSIEVYCDVPKLANYF